MLLFELLRVMTRVVYESPVGAVDGENDLETVGGTVRGAFIVREELPAKALLPLLVCNAPTGIELRKLPEEVPVTFTVMVQEALTGMDPPVKVTTELPGEAVNTPPQVVVALPLTVNPAGKVSTSGAESIAAEPLGLLSVMVRSEVPPTLIEAGVNDFAKDGGTGGSGETVSVATAGAVLFPLLVCREPAKSELKKLPAAGAVRSTVTTHEPPAGMAPPVSVTVPLPTAAVTVPPQVVTPTPETMTPLGNVSVNGVVKPASVALGLLSVMVRIVVPPATIEAGVKDLFKVGETPTTGTATRVATAGAALLPLLV
jgi:hypothetical protein